MCVCVYIYIYISNIYIKDLQGSYLAKQEFIMLLIMRILIKWNHLAKEEFIKQLPMQTNIKILHLAIALKDNTLIIIN